MPSPSRQAPPLASRPSRRAAAGRRRPVRLLLAALLLPLLAVPAAPAAEDAASRVEELRRIRSEIGELEQRLARVRERAEGVAGQLQAIEVELALQEQRLAEARAARDVAADEVAGSEEEVFRLTAAVEGARADLTRRLGGLYRLGGQHSLRLLLSLESDGEDLLSGLRILRYLARRDARAVDSYTAARDRLQEERSLLVARRRGLEGWVAEEEERRGELAAARERQAAILDRIEGERRRIAQRTGELEDRERKMTRFLELLAGESGGGPAGVAIQELRGVLDPPVDGRVTAGFGPRLDPRYRTRVPHNGFTYATPAGSAVRAVYAGEVLYAAPFQGYGPTVVVHHPGRVFTLYAGLADLAVQVGDPVALGQSLGRSDDDLYFEVRVEKRPEDPAEWLR